MRVLIPKSIIINLNTEPPGITSIPSVHTNTLCCVERINQARSHVPPSIVLLVPPPSNHKQGLNPHELASFVPCIEKCLQVVRSEGNYKLD